MIWTDQTHFFAATDCKHLGRPCPAAERMIAKLAEAMTKAKPLTQEDFEITGTSALDGCPRKCPAQFVASHDRIRLYCGVGEDAPREGLDQFADAILNRDGKGFAAGALKSRPCALMEALPKSAEARQAEQMMAL
ncbi:hypothetical protein RA19_04820 [Leisingera sp. ANG-M1]|uniref:hypothetical protein n=1 Tax=Leisingera sp. ANG-M1 TaxID=1577895 RepID=UPI00057C86EC|nr:hypothetical protein [Leisingera sp. ANG-M1]KIC11952.1 hypothetical protein RA19_04820 [Leisingera sp. ANG-M1]